MRRDDPLEIWLFRREYAPDFAARQRNEVLFARELRSLRPADEAQDMELSDLQDMAWVQNEYRQVLEAGGAGTKYLQETLLDLIALTAEPRSLPFWVDLIAYKRPRDSFSGRRRVLAFSAIAFLAIQHDLAEAYKTLVELTADPSPDVREMAVEYLGKAYHMTDRPMPAEHIARLSDISSRDKAFGPRYWARRWLRESEVPVELENPDGVYVFKVKFKWAKRIYRSIALRSDQTLRDLHNAIQDAIDWDDDHLYAFFMNGKVHDQRYMIAHPYLEDAPVYVDDVCIGELGLVCKHKFAYFFDYGDSHEFEVEVIDIHPHAEPGPYPRLVDQRGDAPPQYDWGDEEEE